MARTSAADLSHGLRGATFPMTIRQLAEHARQNRAPDDLVETIKRMPDREFSSLAGVEHAFSENQEGGKPKRRDATGAASKAATRRSKH
jgi:hypothetical protein